MTEKKTPFQKHKEEQELKRKRHEEEAAKLYTEFVDSFTEPKPRTFLRGEIIDSSNGQALSAGKKDVYVPPRLANFNSLCANDGQEKQKTDSVNKKRNLDTFLEEIKKEQSARESQKTKHPRLSQPKDASNYRVEPVVEPVTTNLFLRNLSTQINEDTLCKLFGLFGPIASVKVIWPRTDEEKLRNNNCGFVSFMKRTDAENAIEHMNGYLLHGLNLKIGWGKPTPIPASPCYVAPATVAFSKPPVIAPVKTVQKSHAIYVTIPADVRLLKVIHRTIEFVIKFGRSFEDKLVQKEKGNTLFNFLTNQDSSEHVYYRWKTFSILNGDDLQQWRTTGFLMQKGGAMWYPPNPPFSDNYDANSVADENFLPSDLCMGPANLRDGRLDVNQKTNFEQLIRTLDLQRNKIARAMTFAVNHADASEEISKILVDSLLVPDTPIPSKIARMYLMSDILHNSGSVIRNAWKYRMNFQDKLSVIFDHLNSVLLDIANPIYTAQLKSSIRKLLQLWHTWGLFPFNTIEGYHTVFLAKTQEEDSPLFPPSILESMTEHKMDLT